jgi:hypothetical protein
MLVNHRKITSAGGALRASGSLNLFLELVLINGCILRIMLTTVPEILVKKLKKKFTFKIVFVIFQ